MPGWGKARRRYVDLVHEDLRRQSAWDEESTALRQGGGHLPNVIAVAVALLPRPLDPAVVQHLCYPYLAQVRDRKSWTRFSQLWFRLGSQGTYEILEKMIPQQVLV